MSNEKLEDLILTLISVPCIITGLLAITVGAYILLSGNGLVLPSWFPPIP